jgi:hypothetical protein
MTSWRKELNKRGWHIGDMKKREDERVEGTCPHQFGMAASIHQFV